MAEDGKNDNPTEVVAPSQPGAVISPGEQLPVPPTQAPVPPAVPPAVAPAPAPVPPPAATVMQPDTTPATTDFGTVLAETGLYDEPEPRNADGEAVSWTASEFISHEKSASWYFGLVIAAVVLAAIIYWLTRDVVSPAVVIVAALLLAVYGSHKPRQVEYLLNRQGVSVAGKFFPYHEFRSFSVIPEGAFSSIVFMPLKRFALPLTLYYDPKDEDRIVYVLSDQLPLENRRPDAIDSLMRRIRF